MAFNDTRIVHESAAHPVMVDAALNYINGIVSYYYPGRSVKAVDVGSAIALRWNDGSLYGAILHRDGSVIDVDGNLACNINEKEGWIDTFRKDWVVAA